MQHLNTVTSAGKLKAWVVECLQATGQGKAYEHMVRQVNRSGGVCDNGPSTLAAAPSQGMLILVLVKDARD